MEQNKNRKREDMPLEKPNVEGNVWPKQICPAFTTRNETFLKECWYCVYADFHLDSPRALEVGVCYYPKKQMQQEGFLK